tara:strand:- start:379 stop:1848 length:1470 start_codon:yes stop_codon:yes gene_type:complete
MSFNIWQPMKLIHKFFLAFFITNIILVGLMFIFIYMTFSSGFNNYVEQEEKKHVASVKQQLTEFYVELGSWQPITQNTQLWRSIVEPENAPGVPNANKQTSNSQPKQPTDSASPSLVWINLPAGALKTGQRISLYDQNKTVVMGREYLHDNPSVEPILLQGKIIGWIGLVPSRLVQSSPAKAFLSAQFQNYFIITSFIVLLAFIMAIAVSRHLIKPIKKILAGTSELIKGNFTSRINVLSKDELGTLSNHYNELALTLGKNQRSRFQWVSDTSHELRTPLTVLRSHLLAVQDGVFVADESRIRLLLKQVDKLNCIVDDLAQLAHSDTANLTYKDSDVDLVSTFTQTLENYAVRFEQRGITVDSHNLNNAGKFIISGDKERLQQVFTNLLENTCRYTHQGGQLNVKVGTLDRKVVLTLQDSTPGVSPSDKQRLFERFYRVEKSRNRDFGGSGLGLALCEQIVEAHDGHITLHDSPLGGLEVKITFPLIGR